jgi:hypothetical protein
MNIRTKKHICIALGLLAFVLTLGAVGGMELGIMPIGKGAALACGSEALSAALLWKGGVLRV